KRRKLNEEVEDLKRHLEIVPDEDDDVYTEATPLARKVYIVDYEIINLNNKPYYKIIRADETHQLYISFLTLLKNFNREDLEALWSLVKERFSTSKPNNFSDEFLLTTLGAMFKRPDEQAQVWKNQRSIHGQAKVKSWKLLESYGLSAAKQKMMLLDSAAEGTLIPVFIKSLNKKTYCLVVTDDFSSFTWVFFLATKDETPEILKNFIAGLKSSKDKVAGDARKKSTEVPRKENGVHDPAKEGDKNDQEKDLRDQKEALRKQFKQEYERLFGQKEAANTNSTNKLNTVSSLVNVVSSSFTTVDPGRERAQMNEFKSKFGQDKDAHDNSTYMMFTPISVAGSYYVNLGRLILVNAATLPNADLSTDPLMPDLEDTADLQDTGILVVHMMMKLRVVDFNNVELTIVVSSIPTTRIHKDHPKEQIIGDPLSAPQTRRMTKTSQEHDMVRIEAIRLFLAYASFMGFTVYQKDVKSAFLYGTIEEEVYVCQPAGFKAPHFHNKVYKVEKALYGLHQASRAYDIIFGSTKTSLCIEFEGLMHKKFQMSSIGELTFFLGLQVMQRDDGIFISQDKYVADILKKFDFSSVKTTSIPIKTNKALLKDEEAEDVDVHLYRSMIGSLMYLTATRPDIMFAVCAYARF
nr:retrotransposon protein, putative, unclassified [Tanacetum cinerariifolium]